MAKFGHSHSNNVRIVDLINNLLWGRKAFNIVDKIIIRIFLHLYYRARANDV
jgi:hypothetical protein